MTNHYGKNRLQARIASLSVNRETSLNETLKTAAQIQKTGVGKIAINRSQRRFESRQKEKSK